MKKSRKIVAAVLALAVTALCGTVALAAAGGENDPLVTLSYLNQTVIPDILRQVEEKTAAKQRELERDLSAQIEAYKADSGSSEEDLGFTLVTMTEGQTLNVSVGCEMLLRIGSARVNANGSPALIDETTGESIIPGASLEENHLYMATIAERSLTATAASVKILVRGGYTVE